MNRSPRTRFATSLSGAVLALAAGAGPSLAQSPPATIATVVAEAMAFEPGIFGRPQFFDARTPPDWPAALVPPGAKIVGGGVLGDSSVFRMRVAVFEFAAQSNPRAALEDLVARAGYGPPQVQPRSSTTGGFVETAAQAPAGKYCQESTLASFGVVDSVHAPFAFAVLLLDGEAGRQNCAPRRTEPTDHRFPVKVPAMPPPAGVLSMGARSSWGGSDGQTRTTLRTTMPTDSILAHYSAQLAAGGWTPRGRAAVTDGLAVQRFTFRDGHDDWTGALIIMATGGQREVLLQVARVE